MAVHPYRIVNVFTHESRQLSGNPLCVFENGSQFDSSTMQALALQFNLSETAFILPSAHAHARVRIFTPSFEMPFAGHPTLGSAHVCRALGLGGDALSLELGVGAIAVTAAGARWTLTAPAASCREIDMALATLARALGVDEGDIGERPLWVKAGREQLIIPLKSAGAVRRASPRSDAFAGIRSDDGEGMVYLFAFTDANRVLARFFFSQGSVLVEDPATGSATANFGAWSVAMRRSLPFNYEISQGDMVSRPSTLFLSVTADQRIQVGGDVVELARGVVMLN